MSEQHQQLKWDITCTGKDVTISDTTIKIQELYGGFGQGQKNIDSSTNRNASC